MVLPSFVCVLPCNNPPNNKYRMHGCSKGLHVTLEDTANLQASFYPLMAKTILGEVDFQALAVAPDMCAVCQQPVVPRPTLPALYLENCAHTFHHGCLPCIWPSKFMRCCPVCEVDSYRGLLWPDVFATAEAKDRVFQLQKVALGLDVSPQTVIRVDQKNDDALCVNINGKSFELASAGEGNLSAGQQSANWALFLEDEEHLRLVGHYRCPDGDTCPFGRCALSHPMYKASNLANLPPFYCLNSARFGPIETSCSLRIQVDDSELVSCLTGFHPTVDHLESVDCFAADMANQIKKSVEPARVTFQKCHVCLIQASPKYPKSIRMHFEDCDHWVHPECLPQAPKLFGNTKRSFELHCRVCGRDSVRTIAWPGTFLSRTMKRNLIGMQLNAFKMHVHLDTPLSVVQDPKEAHIFTVAYGERKVQIDTSANAIDDCE